MSNPFAQALKNALNQSELAIVSQQIQKDDEPIGFFYRTEPEPEIEHDSGWRFFSGLESDEYLNQSENFTIVPLNKLIENNPEIQSIIQKNSENPNAGAWIWDDKTEDFVIVEDWEAPE